MSIPVINFAHLPSQLQLAKSEFPAVVINKNSIDTIEACTTWIQHHKDALERQLHHSGAILFRGFPIHSAETFDQFSKAFQYLDFTYQESLSNAVRINFTERVFTANEAPKDVEIYLHHEMAQTPISPNKIFFFCQNPAEYGGATPLCRSDMLFLAIQNADPQLAAEFESKGLKYTTQMPLKDDNHSGQGRSWKSTLSVKSKPDAELKLKELGYSWEWINDGGLCATTPVLPAVVELTDGRKVFYNQLIAAYLGWKGVKQDPSSAIKFGDDSLIPVSALELVASLAHQFTFDLEWQASDVALVDNYMAMHGRKPFSGEQKRQILVTLAMD